MILYNELVLKSPFLGSRRVKGRPREIVRYTDNKPGLIPEVWHEAFRLAASDLGVQYFQDALILPQSFNASAFEEYTRTFSKVNKERFEAIPKGAKIWFDVHLFENKMSPNTYAKLLSIVGKQYGMSHWGNKFGYGRFDVALIKRKKVDVQLDLDLLQL